MLFLTVPTRGGRPELLNALLESSGLPSSRVILIRTSKESNLPSGPVIIDDFGPINIQRWWNAGLTAAAAAGATTVAVANDDLAISKGTLQDLAAALESSGASMATPGRCYRLWQRGWPFIRRLDGSLWVTSIRSSIRPNEEFRWAFGDDDLDIRCRLQGLGVVTVPVDASNVHHNEESMRDPILRELSERDWQTFRRLHPWVSSSRIPINAGRRLMRLSRRLCSSALPLAR